jgi:hypothetical protein
VISTGQILVAAAVTGAAAAVAAAAVRWTLAGIGAAALSSFLLIVVWRAISNLLGLNGDYIPAVSVGDTVCLIAGALGPAATAFLPRFGQPDGTSAWRTWLPAAVGGIAGFLINVVIL